MALPASSPTWRAMPSLLCGLVTPTFLSVNENMCPRHRSFCGEPCRLPPMLKSWMGVWGLAWESRENKHSGPRHQAVRCVTTGSAMTQTNLLPQRSLPTRSTAGVYKPGQARGPAPSYFPEKTDKVTNRTAGSELTLRSQGTHSLVSRQKCKILSA